MSIYLYNFHSCLFFSIRQSIPPANNAGDSRQNTRNSSAFFERIDPRNTSLDLSASFESSESKIDAAAEAADHKFSDAVDYVKNDNEDDDLNFGNDTVGDVFSDAEDYAKGNDGSDVEEDCIEEWEENKEILAMKRKYEKEEWEVNGGNGLVGQTVTDAAKDIAKRTYINKREKRKGDVVSGCIHRYIMTEFTIYLTHPLTRNLRKIFQTSHMRRYPK